MSFFLPKTMMPIIILPKQIMTQTMSECMYKGKCQRKVISEYKGWVDESSYCKNYQNFGRNIFLLSKKWISTLFRQTSGSGKWVIGEEYGEPNLGAKKQIEIQMREWPTLQWLLLSFSLQWPSIICIFPTLLPNYQQTIAKSFIATIILECSYSRPNELKPQVTCK